TGVEGLGNRIGHGDVTVFVQGEDGIRDRNVTGVQTCALPIFQAVASGIGIGITPKLTIDKKCKHHKVKIHEIKEISNIPNKVYVQYRENPRTRSLTKKIVYSIINYRYTQHPVDANSV